MPLEEQVKENKIFFNSNITVDMIKVSRNPDMSFNDFVASKNKVDAKTCLWNDFSSGINANYFSQEEDALFVIYRKTPSQKYYDYVCTIGNGQFEFQDYKVAQRQFYHYLAIVRKNDGSYIAYENIDDDFVETGDNLELKSFVKNNIKLSIGMEGDSGYFSDGTRISDYYDYDNDYFDNGVSYQILKNTQTNKYVFGIAWIVDQRPDNEVQTWYGADPSIM